MMKICPRSSNVIELSWFVSIQVPTHLSLKNRNGDPFSCNQCSSSVSAQMRVDSLLNPRSLKSLPERRMNIIICHLLSNSLLRCKTTKDPPIRVVEIRVVFQSRAKKSYRVPKNPYIPEACFSSHS